MCGYAVADLQNWTTDTLLHSQLNLVSELLGPMIISYFHFRILTDLYPAKGCGNGELWKSNFLGCAAAVSCLFWCALLLQRKYGFAVVEQNFFEKLQTP